jgi:DNA-binding NarL/FixJ family response regulator
MSVWKVLNMRPPVPDLPLAPIQIALIEDDPNVQEAVRAAIVTAPDMALVAQASTHAQAMQLLMGAPVDVLLVDLGLPDGSGIDVIRAASARWPACSIMVSTVFGDEAHVMRSIEAGACGYLLKDSAPEHVVAEIRSLHAGGSPISPLIARKLLMNWRQQLGAGAEPEVFADLQTHGAPLSTREREVLQYITKGFTVNECAALLSVSQHTVQTHVRRIYTKLDVNSKAEAIFEARYQGLLPR